MSLVNTTQTLLDKVKQVIQERLPGMVKKQVVFHDDNAPARSGAVAEQKLRELKIKLLPHSLYSPDLAPSDFHLFPKLKTFLAEKRFLGRLVLRG